MQKKDVMLRASICRATKSVMNVGEVVLLTCDTRQPNMSIFQKFDEVLRILHVNYHELQNTNHLIMNLSKMCQKDGKIYY